MSIARIHRSIQAGAPASLPLPTDVRAALLDLVRESGHGFILWDNRGRAAVVAQGDPIQISAPPQPRNCVSIHLPSGEETHLSLLVQPSAWRPVHNAWLRAGACLVSSTLRLAAEVENMAAEIARNYEELSLLYSSSASLAAAEDSATACEQVLKLATMHISADAAAVYLCQRHSGHFRLMAWRGPQSFWLPSLQPEEATLQGNPVFRGRTMLREHSNVVEMAEVGLRASHEGSILCAPLAGEAAGNRIIGWLVLYDRPGVNRFCSSDVKVAGALAAQGATAVANAQLVEERQALMMGTIRSLASAVDAKDRYTHGHSLRVTEYALAIARQIGCSPAELKSVELSGLLHDVGKIGVPDRVLSKPGPLNEEEWAQMKKHPLIGAAILDKVTGLDSMVTDGVRSHHERFDGAGYPDALRGSEIPLAGRIMSIADCFDAMTSDRPYRSGMSRDAAVEQMAAVSGSQFDPDILTAFLDLWSLGSFPSITSPVISHQFSVISDQS